MADVVVRHCTIRVVRHGGWSWGPQPRVLLDHVLRQVPNLIAAELDRLFPEKGVEQEIAARYQPLIERSEYKLFRPHGPIIGAVEQLAAQELPLLLAEIDRFDRTTPGYPFSALVRCAALTRLSDPRAAAFCDAAAKGVPPDLVTKARNLKP